MSKLRQILLSGVAGLIVWEIFARMIAPLWLGFALDPNGLIEMATGLGGAQAEILHLLTGLVAFPGLYVLVLRPSGPAIPWAVLGMGYGVGLWVFAMYIVASLIDGMPAFLGFEPVAWASLVGHVAMTLTVAAVVKQTA